MVDLNFQGYSDLSTASFHLAVISFTLTEFEATRERQMIDNWGKWDIHTFMFFIVHFIWNWLFLQSVNMNLGISAPAIIWCPWSKRKLQIDRVGSVSLIVFNVFGTTVKSQRLFFNHYENQLASSLQVFSSDHNAGMLLKYYYRCKHDLANWFCEESLTLTFCFTNYTSWISCHTKHLINSL